MNDFLENMEHEFPNIQPDRLKAKGYKIDGDSGVKLFCGLNNLKSVDYLFIPESGVLVFLEFSDLHRYFIDFISKKKELFQKISVLAKQQDPGIKKELDELKRFFIKTIDQQYFSEFLYKFKDTFFLKEVLVDHALLKGLPPEIVKGPVTEYIIVVPPVDHLELHQQQEINKILERLKESLKCQLSKYELSGKIHFIAISQFI